MRLTQHEQNAITQAFLRHFSNQDELWLFGSRVDDEKKGGDIDLYVYTQGSNLDKVHHAKIAFLLDVKSQIGDQKIDVVVQTSNFDAPIYQQARATGIRLI